MSNLNGANEFGPNMSLLEHLNELRKRLVWVAAAVAVCTVISFVFAESFLNYLLVPYAQATGADAGATLQTLRPTEGLETYFKVSLLLGASLAMPVSPGKSPFNMTEKL